MNVVSCPGTPQPPASSGGVHAGGRHPRGGIDSGPSDQGMESEEEGGVSARRVGPGVALDATPEAILLSV